MAPRAGGELDVVLAALADPQRRRAIETLSKGPMRASDLASSLAISPPAMSRHLKVLREAGLVRDSHPDMDARVRVYAIDAAGLGELKSWLERAEAGWTQQLTAFKRFVEQKT